MDAPTSAEFLTPAEFARLAVLSLATVRRRISDGSLPVFQPGGKRTAMRIPRSALTATPSSLATSNSAAHTPAAQISNPLRRRPNWTRR